MATDPVAEATAVSRAQDGDLDAFAGLVEHYQNPLFRLALRTVRDRPLAEDIVQEAFIAAWRKLPSLAEPAAFRGWIYQIVTFRCLDALRRRQTEPARADGFDPDSAATRQTVDPALLVEQQAQSHDLGQALGELPTEVGLCWVLREVHGLSYAEVATALNVPVSTVRYRLSRARRDLAERMASWR